MTADAPLDTRLSPMDPRAAGAASIAFHGLVRLPHITPRAFLHVRAMPEITLVAGRGIEGDRDTIGREEAFYSDPAEYSRQTTLLEIETLEALQRDAGIIPGSKEHGRNVTVEGVLLNHLVGRRCLLGETWPEATRLSIPCRHIEEMTGKAIFDPPINRVGVNCRILEGGVVRTGDVVRSL